MEYLQHTSGRPSRCAAWAPPRFRATGRGSASVQAHTGCEEEYPRSATQNVSPTLENDLSDALDRLDRSLVFGEITLSEYGDRHAEIVEWFEEHGVPVARDETD